MPPGPKPTTEITTTPTPTTLEITPFEPTPTNLSGMPDLGGITSPSLSSFAIDPANPTLDIGSGGLTGGTLQLLGDTPPLQLPPSEPTAPGVTLGEARSSPLLIAAAALCAVPFFGPNFVRSYIFNEPMMLRPPLDPNKAVMLGFRGQGALRWMKDAAGHEGYTVRQNGNEQITVNGVRLDPKKKWDWVKSGDIVEAGGLTYVVTSGYEGLPTSLAEMQRMANRPYKLDDSFQQLQGPGVSGSFKRVEGSDVNGRFMSVETDSGSTISYAVEGEGQRWFHSNAAVEADPIILESVNGGSSLENAFSKARSGVQDGRDYIKLNQVGFELKPQSGEPRKIDATFVKDGDVEAIVVRLGGGNKPVFEAKDGVSKTTLQADNDVIVTGRFAESLSQDAVVQIVKGARPQTAEGIRDALQSEALIRMELLKMKPSGGRITHKDYTDAYQAVVGRPAPATYRGLYETNYDLMPNGDVVRAGSSKPVDHFSDEAEGFLVQIAGK